MNRRLSALLALGAFALAGTLNARTARADLFALAPSVGQILRIDSTTLEVTRTYDSPSGPFGPTAFAGIAFDGRMLSWTQSLAGGAFHELYQLDVVSEAWMPPIPLFDVLPPLQLAGLGALGPNFGGQLVGVASTPVPFGFPATFYRIEPFGFAQPVGELPPQYNAFGLDVDAETGEIWVAARNFDLAPPTPFELLQVGIPELSPSPPALVDAGFVEEPQRVKIGAVILRTLNPQFIPPGTPRGIAFDDGRMFVVSTSRYLHEIDRTSGGILRTVQIPGTFLIGGLTGGSVVPEPSGAIVAMIAAVVSYWYVHTSRHFCRRAGTAVG